MDQPWGPTLRSVMEAVVSSLLGADPVRIDALARRYDDMASQFVDAAHSMTAELKQVDWRGEDAQRMRSKMKGLSRRTERESAALITSAAKSLRKHAADQREVSVELNGGPALGVGPFNPGFQPWPGSSGYPPPWVDALQNGSFILNDAALTGVVKGSSQFGSHFTTGASGYTRANGTVVQPYVRYQPGYAGRLNPVVSANTANSKWLGRAGKFGTAGGFVIPGVVQAAEDWDRDDLDGADKAGRVATRIGFMGGGAWAGASVGATVGASIGAFFGPADVATVPIGGAIGGIVGGIAGSSAGGWVADRLPWMD